jgi:hypothetical protein
MIQVFEFIVSNTFDVNHMQVNRLKELKGDKKAIILMIFVVTFASLNLYQYTELIQTHSELNEARDKLATVSGIIVNSESYEYEESGEVQFNGVLRLTANDSVNEVKAGEISDYRLILDKFVELEVGNLVSGIPIKGEIPTLKVEDITPFFHPPIINTGDYIDFEVVELRTGGPSFYLGLFNLGEKDIISIRAEVNGTLIPFFFGVDKEHPVKPYGYMHETVPTSWFDPDTNRTEGFKPIPGETYPIVVELTLSDDRPLYLFKIVSVWNFSVTAKSVISIGTFVPFPSIVQIRSAYLFEKRRNEDFLSIVVENVWESPVTEIKILVDDIEVADVYTNLKSGNQWEACTRLPFDIFVSSSHNVTVRAITAAGEVAEVSQDVKCVRA